MQHFSLLKVRAAFCRMPTAKKPEDLKATEEDEAPEGHLDGLWKLWSNDEDLRAHMLKTGTLFHWPNPKQTGITNFETMEYNTRVLQYLVDVWCPQNPNPKTIYIPHAREQVCVAKFLNLATLLATSLISLRWQSCGSTSACLTTWCVWSVMPQHSEPSCRIVAGGTMVARAEFLACARNLVLFLDGRAWMLACIAESS